MAEGYLADIKVVHIAGEPTPEGHQYCLICARLLSLSAKAYIPYEDVLEERSTTSRSLARREYVRCTELQ